MPRVLSTPWRCLKAIGRAIRRTWKPVLITVLALNAVVTLSNYLERKYMPKPLFPAAQWDQAKYLSSKNPYRHYEAAARLIPDEAYDVLEAHLLPTLARGPKPTVEEVAQALADVQPAIQELKRGARCSADDFEFAYGPTSSEDTGYLYCEFEQLRQLARVTYYQAEEKLKQGRTRQSLDDLLALDKMASDVTQGADIMGYLVSVAIEQLAIRPIYDAIGTAQLRAEDYTAIAGTLERVDSEREPFRQVMQEEYVGSRRMLLEVLPATLSETWGASLAKRSDLWLYLLKSVPCMKIRITEDLDHAYKRLLDIYARPYPQAVKLDAGRLVPSYDPITQLFVHPELVKMEAETYAVDSAITRGLMLMAALEAYLLEHGQYPDSLDELASSYISKMPTDPFTDKRPFLYSRRGDKYLLYSVGPDMTDDGGKVVRPYYKLTDPGGREPGDLVFAPGLDIWTAQ